MTIIHEPARETPVIHDCDICVVGGSCTGVFAAIRAARLGASVAIVEKQNAFGGVATGGLVHIWHSLQDTEYQETIIGGMTREVIDRLLTRNACMLTERNADKYCRMNTEELKIELDQMVRDAGVVPFLHTAFVAPAMADGAEGWIKAALVENKDGRGAIRAKVFIDASGDGDLAARAGLPFTIDPHLQPPTTCAKIRGLEGLDIKALWAAHHAAYGLEPDAGWNDAMPGPEDVRMYAETHVFGANTADATQLTRAEMEGRRHIRAIMDMVREHHPERRERLCLLDLASYIGIRETRRFQCDHTLTEEEVLEGARFPDAIANGSYRVDVHNPSGGGYVFKYLDGRQVANTAAGRVEGRWREETAENPTFYQIPYRTMVRRDAPNLILAGRTIAAEKPAFGAIRVMVNCNQTGEAAGVAAHLAIQGGAAVAEVDAGKLRATMTDGGSILF